MKFVSVFLSISALFAVSAHASDGRRFRLSDTAIPLMQRSLSTACLDSRSNQPAISEAYFTDVNSFIAGGLLGVVYCKDNSVYGLIGKASPSNPAEGGVDLVKFRVAIYSAIGKPSVRHQMLTPEGGNTNTFYIVAWYGRVLLNVRSERDYVNADGTGRNLRPFVAGR